MGRYEMDLVKRLEKNEDLDEEAGGSVEEMKTFKRMLTARERTGLVFKNAGQSIITENNLTNNSKACSIQ